MKKLYTFLILGFCSLTYSQTILTETFDYPVPGNIGGNTTTANDNVGSNNWLTHSNTTGNSGSIDLIAGSLTYNGLVASTGNKIFIPGNNTAVPRDVNRSITTTETTIYISLLLNVIDNTQLNAGTPGYFFGIGGTAGTTITSLACRLGINSSNGGDNYKLHIQSNTGGSPNFTEFPTDLNFGTTYLVVLKYDRSASPNVATLWVNPASLGGSEASGSVSNSSGTTNLAAFASIYIRNAANSGTTASGTPKAEIDEIRVGTTWASVTPEATASVIENNIPGLKMYPNPAKNGQTLFITSDSSVEKNVAIYNVLGRKVLEATTQQNTINTNGLTTGVYMVKITEEGKTSTRKLVIQ